MIVTAKILDNIRKVNIQEVSVIVKGNPIKVIKAGKTKNSAKEIKSNYNIENGFVRLYNSFKYQTGDLWNTYT